MTYKPKFEIVKPEEAVSVICSLNDIVFETNITEIPNIMQPQVAERHFLDLRKKYGAVLAADLVNKVKIFFPHTINLVG